MCTSCRVDVDWQTALARFVVTAFMGASNLHTILHLEPGRLYALGCSCASPDYSKESIVFLCLSWFLSMGDLDLNSFSL